MERWERDLRQAEARSLRAHCEKISHVGWALFWMAVSMLGLQLAAVTIAGQLDPDLVGSPMFLWAVSVVSVYGVGMPLCWLITRRQPAPPKTGADRPLKPARFLQVFLIALAGLYLSNYVTLAITGLIGLLRGSPVPNPTDSIRDYPVVLSVLLGCVIAPVAEEAVFRGLLLDRLRPYGDKVAVCASALCFGLFHGNLNQFLYAFVIGLVFGYVALRTGRIRQTILLHAMVNAISTALVPLAGAAGEWGMVLLGFLVLLSIPLGLIFFFTIRRELWFDPGQTGLSERRKWGLFFGSPGVVLFLIVEGLMMASYFL